MLENVASMSDQDAKVITAALDAIGVRINSSLVSGQFRDRYYWTNIPGTELNLFGNYLIQPPINRNIHFADILESGTTNRDKALCLSARGGGGVGRI
ncbi:hypothetical protein EZS27_029786 [termite gut metagenome]|uniref:DNA (cytosine-5-)-methyltransferase n=1 Tax=termite gut metagenome TaxID=433724 RepID=A0A5J4QHE4_9ZZZZ